MKLILKNDVKYFFGVKVRGPKKSCMARGPDHGLVGPPLKPPLPEENNVHSFHVVYQDTRH